MTLLRCLSLTCRYTCITRPAVAMSSISSECRDCERFVATVALNVREAPHGSTHAKRADQWQQPRYIACLLLVALNIIFKAPSERSELWRVVLGRSPSIRVVGVSFWLGLWVVLVITQFLDSWHSCTFSMDAAVRCLSINRISISYVWSVETVWNRNVMSRWCN